MESKFDVKESENLAVESIPDQFVDDNSAPHSLERPSRWNYLAAASLIFGMVAEAQLFNALTIIATPINTDLGLKKEWPWIIESYLFTAAVLSPLFGVFSDRLGRRWFVVIGNLIAVVGAIICATAHSTNIVIVGMAIAGLGTTGQHVALAGLSELFPRKHRALAQGSLLFATFPFVACGTIIGAAMTNYASWRWAYYLHIILSGIAFILTFLFYNPPLPEKHPLKSLRNLDWIQPILFLLASGSAALGGGLIMFHIYQWSSPAVLVPLLVGFGILCVWVFRVYTYTGSNPLFPRAMFTPQIIILLLISGWLWMFVFVITLLWFNEVQYVYTQNLIKVGEYSFPAGFGAEIGIVVSALFIRKLGPTRYQLATAGFFLTLFTCLLATLTSNSVRPALAYLSLAGVASGYVQVLLPAMLQLICRPQDIGTITGFYVFCRYVGGAGGLIMSLTIFTSRVGSTLVPNINKITEPLGLPLSSVKLAAAALDAANITAVLEVPGITIEMVELALVGVVKTYEDAYRIAYYPLIAVGVLVTAAALFFAPNVLPLMTNHLAIQHSSPWFLRLRTSKRG